MDAFARLALMAKAKLVFESEGTFLSFPALSPLSYPPERLKFGKPGDMTAQDLADLSEFARITNQIPRGVLAPVEEGEYLWDIYREVLRTAQLSTGDLSPDEKARYDQAMTLLYTRSADGLRQDSEALRTYKQYRDAHIKAQEEYKNQQFTAESSEDAAVQARWRGEDEPRLRQEVKRLEEEWLARGLKAQVEAAQQVELACAARTPSVTWEEWKTSFIDDLDMATDTNLIRYAVTGFSPYDLFDGGNWPRFTLTNAEMTRLARQVPTELSTIFGSNLANAAIESVSFEYRSVAVMRPWFRPALLKSRFWRLPGGAELSDGATPPQGRCPAYVTALVFARNVTIQARQQSGAPSVTFEAPSTLLRLDPATLELNRARLMQAKVASPPVAAAPVRHVAPSAAVMQARVTPRPDVARTAAVSSPVTARTIARPVAREALAPAGVAPLNARVRLESLNFAGIERVPAQPDPRVTMPRPAPPAATPTSEVTVLAFICKRVPRCPDPDPALSWL